MTWFRWGGGKFFQASPPWPRTGCDWDSNPCPHKAHALIPACQMMWHVSLAFEFTIKDIRKKTKKLIKLARKMFLFCQTQRKYTSYNGYYSGRVLNWWGLLGPPNPAQDMDFPRVLSLARPSFSLFVDNWTNVHRIKAIWSMVGI